jgi:hypothetical protein
VICIETYKHDNIEKEPLKAFERHICILGYRMFRNFLNKFIFFLRFCSNFKLDIGNNFRAKF